MNEYRPAAWLLAILLLYPPVVATAQTYIRIEPNGVFNEEAINLLSELIEPSGAATFERIVGDRAEALETYCAGECFRDLLQAIETDPLATPSNPPGRAYSIAPVVTLPGRGQEQYVIVRSGDLGYPIRANGIDSPVALPFDALKSFTAFGQLEGMGDLTYTPLDSSQPVIRVPQIEAGANLLDTTKLTIPSTGRGDIVRWLLDTDGDAKGIGRTFVLRDGADLSLLTTIAAAAPGLGLTVEEDPELEDMTFFPPADHVDYLADPGQCAGTGEDWPFNAEQIHGLLEFGSWVLEKKEAGPPEPALVVVIDTGIDEAVLQGPLAPVFAPNSAEMLSADRWRTVLSDRLADMPCVDADRNGFGRDVFGAAAEVGNPCNSTQVHPVLAPGRQPDYWPDHGGYVAGLVAGGPAFLAFGDAQQHISLRAYRTLTADNRGFVWTQEGEVAQATRYALAIGANIINFSGATRDTSAFPLGNRILIVVAAGNKGERLGAASPSSHYPANAGNHPPNLVVVGAYRLEDGKPVLWNSSARGPDRVDIAAPGVAIPSFDRNGDPVCRDGTSAAAGIVSFTLGAMVSLGLEQLDARMRLLAAAEHHVAALEDPPNATPNDGVAKGRRLDIATSLNVFVDQVWSRDGLQPGEPATLREGWLLKDADGLSLLAVCGGEEDFLVIDKVDLSRLLGWWRGVSGTVELNLADPQRIRPNDGAWPSGLSEPECTSPPQGSFAFFDLRQGTEVSLPWATTDRIVPSPFRAVGELIQSDEARQCYLSLVANPHPASQPATAGHECSV